jgi:hypothetical protein
VQFKYQQVELVSYDVLTIIYGDHVGSIQYISILKSIEIINIFPYIFYIHRQTTIDQLIELVVYHQVSKVAQEQWKRTHNGDPFRWELCRTKNQDNSRFNERKVPNVALVLPPHKKDDEGSISKTSRADLKKQQEEWEQEVENLFQPYGIYRGNSGGSGGSGGSVSKRKRNGGSSSTWKPNLLSSSEEEDSSSEEENSSSEEEDRSSQRTTQSSHRRRSTKRRRMMEPKYIVKSLEEKLAIHNPLDLSADAIAARKRVHARIQTGGRSVPRSNYCIYGT